MSPLAKEYRDRILAAFEDGYDDALVSICKELERQSTLYLEIWSTLPSTTRRTLKELRNREP